MGKPFPKYPGDVQDGDEPSHSPNKTHKSILGVERGTDSTRRLEMDAAGNAYVNMAASDATAPNSVSALSGGAISGIPPTTLSTIATFTAAIATRITRIGCSGTCYAKFQLFLNTVAIETKRSGPERSIDFIFERPLSMAIGDILDVKVTHFVTAGSEDFESTIYGG